MTVRRPSRENPATLPSDLQSLISQRASIDEQVERLTRLRGTYAQLLRDREKEEELALGVSELESVIRKQEEEARIELAVHSARQHDLQKQLMDPDKIGRRKRQLTRDVNRSLKMRDRLLEVRDRGIAIKLSVERMETKAQQLQVEIGVEKSRLERLSHLNRTMCEECGAELGESQTEQVRNDSRSTFEHKVEHLRQVESDMQRLETERQALREEYVKLDRQLQNLPAWYRELAEIEWKAETVRNMEQQIRHHEEEISRIRFRLDHQLIARAERHALQDLMAKRKLLNWDPGAARRLEEEMRTIEDAEWKKRVLDFIAPLHPARKVE